jgi:hypothetical protein
MAITHGPGERLEPDGAGRRHWRAAVLAVAALVAAAIILPFTLAELDLRHPHAGGIPVPAPHVHPPRPDSVVDQVGPRRHLPPLLPARAAVLRPGLPVRVGDVTEGTLRLTTGGSWQVVVRWGGRSQPLPTSGPVALAAATSWVSERGSLYTRVATGTSGRFLVYAWVPRGGSAYLPPTLVARSLGAVCFEHAFSAFTAFGDCARS